MIKLGNNKQNNFLVGDAQVCSVYKGDTFIQGKEVERKETFTNEFNPSSFFTHAGYVDFEGNGSCSINVTYTYANYDGLLRIEDMNGKDMSNYYTLNGRKQMIVENLPHGQYKLITTHYTHNENTNFGTITAYNYIGGNFVV